jgi:hypothetical protein
MTGTVVFTAASLQFGGDQPVTDVHHRLDLQAKLGKLGPQTVDVNVKAF